MYDLMSTRSGDINGWCFLEYSDHHVVFNNVRSHTRHLCVYKMHTPNELQNFSRYKHNMSSNSYMPHCQTVYYISFCSCLLESPDTFIIPFYKKIDILAISGILIISN